MIEDFTELPFKDLDFIQDNLDFGLEFELNPDVFYFENQISEFVEVLFELAVDACEFVVLES